MIENLLAKYEGLSKHIKVVKKNPDIYPTFAEQYTSETVQNNSLVVECRERSRFIGYNDIYLMEANMNSYSYDTSFDGEGAITSAIDYVVNAEQPKMYLLEGHGEAELPEFFREQTEKENMELETFSLLTADAIPEDADGIIVYGPSSDISEEEKELLAGYVSDGRKLMVMAGPAENGTLDPYEPKLLGITAMEKMLGKKKFAEILKGLVEEPQGKPALVPESDKRPEMNTAQEDFNRKLFDVMTKKGFTSTAPHGILNIRWRWRAGKRRGCYLRCRRCRTEEQNIKCVENFIFLQYNNYVSDFQRR